MAPHRQIYIITRGLFLFVKWILFTAIYVLNGGSLIASLFYFFQAVRKNPPCYKFAEGGAMTRIAINGFGRMGQLLQAAWDYLGHDIVHINEAAADAAVSAHLLAFDSTHGRWRDDAVRHDSQGIYVDNQLLTYAQSSAVTEWIGHNVKYYFDAPGLAIAVRNPCSLISIKA